MQIRGKHESKNRKDKLLFFRSAVDEKKVKMEQEVKRYGYTHALSALEQRDKKRK